MSSPAEKANRRTTIMTAPPSDAFRIVDVHDPFAEVARRRGCTGTFVGSGNSPSPWVPFGDNAAIKHLAFDVRSNIFSNILWIKSRGVIGTHYHRGRVVMMCLEGSVRYLEYDWVAGPGDFIQEAPGEAHTLVTDHEQGVKLFGWMQGPIEFYNDQGEFVSTLDVWWYINHYETWCQENGLEINPQLYL